MLMILCLLLLPISLWSVPSVVGSLQGFNETLMNWDQTYYAQKQQQALYNLTDEDVRPYFAYPTVLAGLHKVGHSQVPLPPHTIAPDASEAMNLYMLPYRIETVRQSGVSVLCDEVC